MTSNSARNQSCNLPKDLGLPGNRRAILTPMMMFATLKLAVSRNQMTSRNIRFKYPTMQTPSRIIGSTSDSSFQSDAQIVQLHAAA